MASRRRKEKEKDGNAIKNGGTRRRGREREREMYVWMYIQGGMYILEVYTGYRGPARSLRALALQGAEELNRRLESNKP